MLDIIVDVLLDTLKTLPFLYITYLFMEYLEDYAKSGSIRLLTKYPAAGPVVGAVLGVIPQCGFSAAAASLYSGGVITLGTMIAIFLSTSDEMLPLMISEQFPLSKMSLILGGKIVIGLVSGLLVDFAFKRWAERHDYKIHKIHDLCEEDHCGCDEDGGNIFLSALIHTIKIAAFLVIVSFFAALFINAIGEKNLSAFLKGKAILGVFITGLIGMVPNCAASVCLTTLYMDGLITYGQVMAGLLTGAGVGLLVLFRSNRHSLKGNMKIAGLLYAIGVFFGLLLSLPYMF